MVFTPDYACSNPSCKSYGHPHPNCRCQGPGEQYAEGGAVHFCTHKFPHEYGCEHFADGGDVVANQEFEGNPDLAIDHAVVNHGLLHTLTKTGHSKSPEKHRAHEEFLDSSRKGRKLLHTHSHSLLHPKADDIEPDNDKAKALESYLASIQANPDGALAIGGNLGDNLPIHHAALAAKAGTAANYLQSIKPQPTPGGSLDEPLPPSDLEQKRYHRQLDLAENPQRIYQHARDGRLIPDDFKTISAIYPKLRSKMQDHAFETLADAKATGKELTHHQKRKVGAMLGEPVSLQQSPMAAQAIMKANAPQQMPQAPEKKPKKASGVELKQLNEVNKLSETPLQRLQTSRNS